MKVFSTVSAKELEGARRLPELKVNCFFPRYSIPQSGKVDGCVRKLGQDDDHPLELLVLQAEDREDFKVVETWPPRRFAWMIWGSILKSSPYHRIHINPNCV